MGPNGWLGVRLEKDRVDWDLVEELVEDGYRLIAPKKLVAQLGSR
jgi:predicted DNA-binding protein (MmcQ/YjbR family)